LFRKVRIQRPGFNNPAVAGETDQLGGGGETEFSQHVEPMLFDG
jgi:hypothetical protein